MIRLLPVLSVLSVTIAGFAVAMLLPLGISILYADGAQSAYDEAVAAALLAGGALWVLTRKHRV